MDAGYFDRGHHGVHWVFCGLGYRDPQQLQVLSHSWHYCCQRYLKSPPCVFGALPTDASRRMANLSETPLCVLHVNHVIFTGFRKSLPVVSKDGYIICAGGFASPFFMYLGISLLYACVAGALVSFVEPLAAGSGIAEIKTYLNGIHIRGLLAVYNFPLCQCFALLGPPSQTCDSLFVICTRGQHGRCGL